LLAIVEVENGVRVVGERGRGVDETELATHAEVHDENEVIDEPDQDVFPTPPDGRDGHPNNRINEHLGLGVTNDGRKPKLATNNGPTNKVRPQISSNSLDFRQFRHGLVTSPLPRGGAH